MAKAKLNLNSKVAKYFVAHRVKGMSKSKAVKVAGIRDIKNVTNYERMPTYKALEERYKDKLLGHIGMDEVALKHANLIRQDDDKAVQLNAIKVYLDRVEPEAGEGAQEDTMVVVMRK